jgi:hypothetical protein
LVFRVSFFQKLDMFNMIAVCVYTFANQHHAQLSGAHTNEPAYAPAILFVKITQ